MQARKPPLERDSTQDPQIDTPVIDLDAGVDELPELDLSKEDEKARKAIEEFEQSLRGQPPG